MFQKTIILVTAIASSLRINGEVLHNDDFTELSATFITQKSRRVYGEGTLIETNILSFEKCLYSCTLYLKCGFVNYHEDQKVCELLANVTTTKIDGGWLTSRTTNGADLVCGSDDSCLCQGNFNPDDGFISVEGGLSPWSLWTSCTAYCGSGTRTRKRMCRLQKSRCGGQKCDPTAKLSEEETCEGLCKETRITDPSNGYCLEPAEGRCNPADKTVLVYRLTSSQCQDNSSKFAFDPDKGTLYHVCSKKPVCAKDGKLEYGNKIVIDSNCPKMTYWGFSRNIFKCVQLGDYFCLDTHNGYKKDKTLVGLWSGCKTERRQLIFPSADAGKVTAEYYGKMTSLDVQGLLDRADFKQKEPTKTGILDNMVSGKNVSSTNGYRLAAYFVAPMSGNHIFTVSCNAACNVYFKHGPNIDRTNYKIMELTSSTSRFQFDKYPDEQKSKEIFLEVGKKYYLEGLFVAQGGDDHIEIGVYLPDGSSLLPITSYYLSADAN